MGFAPLTCSFGTGMDYNRFPIVWQEGVASSKKIRQIVDFSGFFGRFLCLFVRKLLDNKHKIIYNSCYTTIVIKGGTPCRPE
jgi:hypothetical protein